MESVPQEENDYTARVVKKIETYCHNDWEPNYSMVEFCINQQREGINKLVDVLAGIRSDTPEASIMSRCREDWFDTSRPNATMTLFCFERNREALNRLR